MNATKAQVLTSLRSREVKQTELANHCAKLARRRDTTDRPLMLQAAAKARGYAEGLREAIRLVELLDGPRY